MIITKLDKVGTKQVRLFFDEEKYCLLYYNEIRRLGFHEQDEIGQEEFEELNKLLLHRAKLKAMSLLKYQDRTKKELKERLMRAEFPEFIMEGAVAYVDISMMKNMYAATWNTSQEVRVRFRLRWTFGRKGSLRRH